MARRTPPADPEPAGTAPRDDAGTAGGEASDGRPRPEDLGYEDAVEELEAIIDRIESGEIGLEESLVERRRGERLLQRCRTILDAAEQSLETVTPEDVADPADAEDPSPEA